MQTTHAWRMPLLVAMMAALLFSAAKAEEGRALPFVVMEYNCENLFDTTHDTLKQDHAFTPEGEYHWTPSRLRRKLNALGRVVVRAGSEGGGWHLPDVVGLVEVENHNVMRKLTRGSVLREAGYEYVMTESADERGVDVALMYNPLVFSLLGHHSLRIDPIEGRGPTRDVLYACGEIPSGDTLHIMVVHAPSRRGGLKASEPYRLRVAEKVCAAIDSIRALSPEASILVMGDFNDYTGSKSLRRLGEHGLTNVSATARGRIAEGTYKFAGEWNSLDHMLLSQRLARQVKACTIIDEEWMLRTLTNGNVMPSRTYGGSHYMGGVSDHLPLLLRLEVSN